MLTLLRYKSQLANGSKRPTFLTTEWRNLAMLNYEIDPAILKPYLPIGTTLDAWNEKHYISVVGLMFLDTRIYGLPIPLHRNFEEVNLRFYVRREMDGELRRGVVFIKEIVPRRAITAVARAIYNENYTTMPMTHAFHYAGSAHRVAYEWGHPRARHGLSLEANGEPTLLRDDTEEEFIAEHYWGYAVQRDGGTLEYEVEHPRWRVRRTHSAKLQCDIEQLYGSQFAPYITPTPDSAFLAEGSPVTVRKGIRIR